MYDIEKLIYIVCDYLEAETETRKYNLKIRKDRGLPPNACIWVSSLNGESGYRLGELSERSRKTASMLADICALLEIDQDRLISAVKSMQRWERRCWRWNNEACIVGVIRENDKKRLVRYLKKDNEWSGHFQSTGRKKPWCA